uniref:protein dispatched homolog 3-like n=1 Tax=Myxine glutinosa TaxID=7769 RepID=UPI00358F485C
MDADAVAIRGIQTQLENDKVHPVDRGLWALVGRALANVPFAAVFLAAGLVLPLALAGAMLLRGPPLDIDLSYAAFEVRNHKASRRFDALALALRSQIVMHISTLLPPRRHRHTRELQAENRSTGNEHYGSHCVLTQTLKLSRPAWPCKVNNVEKLIRQLNSYRARQERSTHHVRSKVRTFDSNEPSVKPYYSRLAEQTTLWAKNHGGPVWPGRFHRDAVSVHPPWQQVQPQWHMQLIFVARNEGTHLDAGVDDLNIFTPERLEVVRRVERSVMSIPGFQEFCWRPRTAVAGWPGPKDSETPPCAPPTSLLSYLYPSEHDGKLWFDGLGSDLADINGSLHLALTHPQTYWFVDATLDVSTYLRSRLLRAELALGAPLPGFDSARDRPTLQRESVRSFMLGYAELLPTLSTNSVRVLYGGPDLFDNEVRETFRGDVRLAIVSATFIALLVFLLTHASLFLTVVGLGAIAVSCLLALFLYRVALSVRYLGILNGVAAFVVIGIGVDDVFVFVNAYQQTASLSSRTERLSTTLRSASRATFFTSATTAASYAANIGSQVPAVHDFGLFMAIVISCCWVFVSLLLPPALSLWSHFFEDWRLSCCRPTIRIETNPRNTSETSFPLDSGGYLDDDIPLLSASMEEDGEEECGNGSTDGDVCLLDSVDEDKARGFVAWLSGLSWLQSALTCWVVIPAIKAKGKVLGIYVLILLLASWASFRLRLASHPPLLFRPETNIQSLLNLQDNLSSPAIACHTCSGASYVLFDYSAISSSYTIV